MKKTFYLLSLCLFLFLSLCNGALSAEQTVQLDVPGCRPCGAAKRLIAVMKKIDGIIKYENKNQRLLVITFEDEKTTLNQIIDELNKGGFSVEGEAVILK